MPVSLSHLVALCFKGLDGAPFTHLPWQHAEPNGQLTDEGCVLAVGLKYLDVRCDSFESCFPCQITGQKIFRMRGLINELSEIDTDFILPLDRLKQGHIVFKGLLGKSFIQYNRPNQTWEFIMRQNNQDVVIATLDGAEHFPLGLNSWSFIGKQNKLNPSDHLDLKFTKARYFIETQNLVPPFPSPSKVLPKLD